MVPPLETNSGGLAKDMTLRDAAALAALAGYCAADGTDGLAHGFVARQCYSLADAFLIERERGE